MPKLYSSRHVVKVLEQQGFDFVSQKGSHLKYRKQVNDKILTAIIPADRKEIPAGTFGSILRQSGLTKQDFE
jgi:predicted RNA binding protein YcfA (HicA-like mRNA interferase family)